MSIYKYYLMPHRSYADLCKKKGQLKHLYLIKDDSEMLFKRSLLLRKFHRSKNNNCNKFEF